jgi:hypothetical protein
MDINLERIRNHFRKDRFATGIGIVIDSVTEDCVVCSLELNDCHKNSVDGVQGGAIFTLADLAFAVHCNLALACGEGRWGSRADAPSSHPAGCGHRRARRSFIWPSEKGKRIRRPGLHPPRPPAPWGLPR